MGGISRTARVGDWRFDIGGHRFFTKVTPVRELWHEMLPDEDFLLRPRMSRIFYRGRFYDYPLRAFNALRNLGVLEAVRCVLSYLWVRIRPPKDLTTFEGYIASKFGWRLYGIFFKTYTEKVWGVPADQIQPTGRLSASRTSTCSGRSSIRWRRAGTRKRSPASSRSSSIPAMAPG